MPRWTPTVPLELYDAVAEEVSEAFADSYLWGASCPGLSLTPRTVTAWQALNNYWAVREILKRMSIELAKPEPWGSPGGSKLSVLDANPEWDTPKPRKRPEFERW